MKRSVLFSFVGLPLLASAALAQTPVNLNTWTAESYTTVSGFGPGVWTVAGGGNSVLQSVNGQPTLFASDFNAQGTQVQGTLRANGGGDDDFIGFALGYNLGDNSNAAANYLLVDWKRAAQPFDFAGGPANATTGGNAPAGLAVSRVTGTPTADEFWQHANLAGNPSGGLEELQRGNTLGATGWNFNTDYTFSFLFQSNSLDVFVNNVLQLSINGAFGNGSMAFYNFSQGNVTYDAFTLRQVPPDPDPDPNPVPEPTVLAMLALGLAGFGAAARRQRNA